MVMRNCSKTSALLYSRSNHGQKPTRFISYLGHFNFKRLRNRNLFTQRSLCRNVYILKPAGFSPNGVEITALQTILSLHYMETTFFVC